MPHGSDRAVVNRLHDPHPHPAAPWLPSFSQPSLDALLKYNLAPPSTAASSAAAAVAALAIVPPSHEMRDAKYGPRSGQSEAERVWLAYRDHKLPMKKGHVWAPICRGCSAGGHWSCDRAQNK